MSLRAIWIVMLGALLSMVILAGSALILPVILFLVVCFTIWFVTELGKLDDKDDNDTTDPRP